MAAKGNKVHRTVRLDGVHWAWEEIKYRKRKKVIFLEIVKRSFRDKREVCGKRGLGIEELKRKEGEKS